ncbi:uncharacterized protein [Triticum aestivum]|uniref:uncharacterized protein isoform X3 n=1 Tax=Triticum aestivum TaxID=4565 RepID=UPI001D03090F|nr:uncharacterized protein LOC123105620 isoform X3 [Triticum aestivum]
MAEEHPADAAHWMAEQHNAAIITSPLHDDDLLERILISLPGAAFLARAVPVSDRWCRVISDEGFLKRFRFSHPSSPLVGVFVDNKNERIPRFHTGITTANPGIASAVRRTDICLTRLDDALRWRLRDCRNGHLLLSGSDGSLCIYDPLSERRVPIGPRTHLDQRWKCLGDCLLDGLARHMVSMEQRGQQTHAEESFRVISLQWQSNSRFNVRAVEYNSGTLEWRVHPQTGWTKVQLTKLQLKAMYAAGHIFWQTDVARLLVLDTSSMEFSEHGVPWEIVSTSWAIGELRDGKGCLVCLQGLNSSFGKDGLIVEEPLRLEVWALKKEEEDKQAKFCWKCEKGVRVSEMLPEDARVYKVHKVINGLALIGCTKGSYAIDLQTMTLLSKFESGGDIYPYQMSWPPAVLAAATSVVSRHLGANLSNEDSVQIPSKNMDGREGTSSGGSESASLQSQLQVESPNVSGSSGIEDASCDDDNQRALASLGIGDAVHTDPTTAAAINAVNSHASEEETGGWASDGRTKLTTTLEKVAQEVHISQTPLSSEQKYTSAKPFREVHEQKKRFARRFTGCREEFSSKNKRKIHEGSSAHVELSTNRINCVSTSPAGGPEAHEEPRPTQVVGRRTSNRPRKPNKLRHKCTKHYKEQHEQGRRKDISTESLTHMCWRHSIAVCTSLNLLCLCSIFCTCSLDTVAAVLRILQAFQYLKTAAGCQGQGCGSTTEEA